MATISKYTLIIDAGEVTKTHNFMHVKAENIDRIDFGVSHESVILGNYVERLYPSEVYGKTTSILSVMKCDFSMGMFKSGHIVVEMNLVRTASVKDGFMCPLDKVQDALQGAKIRLTCSDSENHNLIVANNYFIYDVKCIATTTGDDESTTVILDIYSMEKLLDMQPMTKAYTAQKLSMIINEHLKDVNYELSKQKGLIGALKVKTENHLNLLCHTYESGQMEMLLPYSVQFNETFYNFLSRICARTGEFLYFEDGVLHYGLSPIPSGSIKAGDYKSICIQKNTNVFKSIKVDWQHRNSTQKAEDSIPESGYHNVSPLGNDELLKTFDLRKKDKTFILADIFATGNFWVNGYAKGYADLEADIKELYNIMRKNASASSASKAKLATLLELVILYPISRYNAIKKKNNLEYDCFMGPDSEKDEDDPKKQVFNYIESEQKDSQHISHFNTIDTVAKNTNNIKSVNLGELTEKLYDIIYDCASEASNREISIDLGNYATNVKLGSEITIPTDHDKYLVTSIEGSVTMNNSIITESHRIVRAIPEAKLVSPIDNKEEIRLWLPTPIDNRIVKAQGPMTGFVTQTNDPYKEGRVRVRLSWQNANAKDATPWVRVAYPMAGDWGSLTLKLKEGDEVLVDFENGNMERPYVRGSLFNKDNQAPTLGEQGCALQTGKGSGLYLSDEQFGLSDWVSLVSPVIGGAMKLAGLKDIGAKPVGGKIELKDYYGFYNVSMSSKDRKVSISSPLGNISINAFTGISISAPNGDIKIEGKNVDIKAGNRLSLTSGTNVGLGGGDGRSKTAGGTTAEIILSIVKAIVDSVIGKKLLDLSLVRAILEIYLRPVNGTLQIKSRRHLVLEAGRGAAEIPYDSIKASANAKYKNVVNSGYPYYVIRSLFQDMHDQSDKVAKGALQSYNAIVHFMKYKTREDDNTLDNDNTTGKVNAFWALPEDKRLCLSVLKCKQVMGMVQLDAGTGKYVYKKNNQDRDKLCPIPLVKANGVNYLAHVDPTKRSNPKNEIKKWLAMVDEFGTLVCNHKNAMLGSNLMFNEAIDAVVESLTAKKLLNRKTSIQKVFKSLKDAIDAHTNSEFILKDGNDQVVSLKEESLSRNITKAEKFSISGGNPANYEIAYLFISCLNKAKIISYVGKQEPMANGFYDKNVALPELNTIFDPNYANVDGAEPEVRWASFVSGLVPYFEDNKKIGFLETAGNKLQGYLESEVDYDNIKAIEGMFNGERDMWDATVNRGSIVMSDGEGVKTARLENDGTFNVYENASVKTMIAAFKNASVVPFAPVLPIPVAAIRP